MELIRGAIELFGQTINFLQCSDSDSVVGFDTILHIQKKLCREFLIKNKRIYFILC